MMHFDWKPAKERDVTLRPMGMFGPLLALEKRKIGDACVIRLAQT
jgi:hypothetical protein